VRQTAGAAGSGQFGLSKPASPGCMNGMSPFTPHVTRSVAHLGEKALIALLVDKFGAAAPPAPEGPGDDCAVLDDSTRRGRRLVTTDSVIYGRHFDAGVLPEDVGRKLIRRNVSDIAAMGGRPSDAILSLQMGGDVDAEWLARFAAGMREAALENDVRLVGGDVVRVTRGAFAAWLTLTGFAEKPMLRTGGRPGDFVYVTGTLGGSILGRHFAFRPRVDEGVFFAAHPAVRAGMDLTDGIAKDLPALIPDKAAAMLALGALPFSDDCLALAAKQGLPPAHLAITDGEDYELLVLADAAGAEAFEADFRARFPETKLTLIGRIVPAAGLSPGRLYDDDGAEIPEGGFDHFA